MIASARAEALDRVLGGLAIVGLIGAPLSASRSLVTGWSAMYSFHLLAGFVVVAIWLFRSRIPHKVRFWMIIGLMWAIGTVGVITLGMMGAGTWWLASSALVGGMSMSPRVGMGLAVAAIAFILAVAMAFAAGLLTVSLDLDAYMSAFSTWATYIMVAAWLPMVIFSAFVKHSEIVGQLAEETAKTQWELQQLANVDSLTGALRPHVLEERLKRAVAESADSKDLVGVVFIDLDKFKPINDTYGHAAGDAILVAVAERAATVLRAGDLISRKGGDEFVIVLPGIKSEVEARIVARKLRRAISKPFVFEGEPLAIELSMGVAVGAHGGVSGSDLLKAADKLMYEAKRGGRGNCLSCTLAA